MRIAIITETFAPATDGICTRLTTFVRQFRRMGHEVIVISPDLGIAEYEGVPVYGLETFTFPLYGSRPWGLPSKQVKPILEAFQPDIVHAVNPFLLATSGVKYAKKLDIPLLTSYHTHMPKYLDYYDMPILKPVFWEYIRYWHNKSDLNITVSASLMDELLRQDIPTEGVLPRGIDLDQRHPKYYDAELYERLTFGLPNQKLLVYIGRLAAEKSLETLRPMLDARDDLCLAIVGDGPYRQDLETMFKGTKATFRGFLQGDALAQAYATGDAFIFPSTSETFGLVISEAMAAGMPVIAAASQPTCEQISDRETGFIYEAENHHSLMTTLDCLDQPMLMKRIKLNARRAVQSYSWENATLQLLDFYEEAIYRHASAKGQRHIMI